MTVVLKKVQPLSSALKHHQLALISHCYRLQCRDVNKDLCLETKAMKQDLAFKTKHIGLVTTRNCVVH